MLSEMAELIVKSISPVIDELENMPLLFSDGYDTNLLSRHMTMTTTLLYRSHEILTWVFWLFEELATNQIGD